MGYGSHMNSLNRWTVSSSNRFNDPRFNAQTTIVCSRAGPTETIEIFAPTKSCKALR